MTTEIDEAAFEAILDAAEEAAEFAAEQAAGEVFAERLPREQFGVALGRLRATRAPFYIDPEYSDDLKHAILRAQNIYVSAMGRDLRAALKKSDQAHNIAGRIYPKPRFIEE